MNDTAQPRTLAVVLYESADDVFSRAAEHFPAHAAHAEGFRAEGTLLMIGLFGDPQTEGSMAVFTDRGAAERFVENDPFVVNGVVRRHEIRDWTVTG